MDKKDVLQKFYKSPSLNFDAFQKATERQSPMKSTGSTSQPHTTPAHANQSPSLFAASTNSSPGPNVRHSYPPPTMLQPLPTSPMQPKFSSTAHHLPPISEDKIAVVGATTGSYIEFLRQQQHVHKLNAATLQTLAEMTEKRRTLQAELLKLNAAAMDTVHQGGASANWGLASKYDCGQLVRDCILDVDPAMLIDGALQPNVSALSNMAGHLHSLQTTGKLTGRASPEKESPEDLKLFFEQAQRRLSSLISICEDSNSDYSNIATSLDTMLVSIEQCLDLGDVEDLVTDSEEKIDQIAFVLGKIQKQMESAVEDGEVQIAEKCVYDCLERNEELLQHVIAKSACVERAIETLHSLMLLHDKHYGSLLPVLTKLRAKYNTMKSRCLADIAKMYALRNKVEEVEGQTAAKVHGAIVASDKFLVQNNEKIDAVFGQFDALERNLEMLLRERQKEYLRRFMEKDKDEHRKTEYVQFCRVVTSHAVNVERTVKNMDALIHSTEMAETLGELGFGGVHARCEKRMKLLLSVQCESQKQHADILRQYFHHVGDIQYRKERMLEEIDNHVQQAFIQKEIYASTFSPNAKKFGDIKKKLLHSRADLEEDVNDLVARANSVMGEFRSAERYLKENNIEFIHPSHAQTERSRHLRARAIESRAAIAGHSSAADPILTDIHKLQRESVEVAKEAERINEATSSTLGRTIPILRAASRSMHQTH